MQADKGEKQDKDLKEYSTLTGEYGEAELNGTVPDEGFRKK